MTQAQRMRDKIKEKNKGQKKPNLIPVQLRVENSDEPDLIFDTLDKVTSKVIKPSPYQENFYLKVITTKSDIAVDSTAGSGKTFTLVEGSKLIPYGKRVIFVAFNKSIVNELKGKLENGVECSTMHSVGIKAIFNHYRGDNSVNDKKAIKYIEPLCNKKLNKELGILEERKPKEKWSMIYRVDDLMKKIRATMTPLIKESIEEMSIEFGLDSDEETIGIAIRALKKFYEYNDNAEYGISIDFQDMIEHCVRNREIRMPQFDYVLVDEIQDLSAMDHIFIGRLVKPGGRIFVFGDPNQSIYSFRGADVNSFQRFQERPNTITLPLSICYRCTKAIVREAQKIYPVIEAWEGAEEGVEPRKGKLNEVREGDWILCRNTRPLIEVFFYLIEQGKKAYVCGKDAEQGLLNVLAGFEGEEICSQVIDRLQVILDNKEEQLRRQGILHPEKHPKYGILEDKILILKILFKRSKTVEEVEEFIKNVFDDEEREGIALMTIHRAKGRENDRVFWIREFDKKVLIPSSYATSEKQLKQEKNLSFVATTRARKELIYLHIGQNDLSL